MLSLGWWVHADRYLIVRRPGSRLPGNREEDVHWLHALLPPALRWSAGTARRR